MNTVKISPDGKYMAAGADTGEVFISIIKISNE
jgi:hypothetical protein